MLRAREDVAWALQHALEQTQSALESAVERPHPTALVANIADLARANAFLRLETGLKAPARLSRLIPAAGLDQPPAVVWLPRALVLAAVAADIYTGYALFGSVT